MPREQLNVVIIGHVDHGKSTLIGRLLADTNALPQGRLEMVKGYCQKNARVFEYAFLLDALKEEQAQGITMDTARCFFKTDKRDYLIFDAPGHVEFIRNMITGAARASAAVVVIDAKEGIQENSRRHGFLLSLLGIRQVSVVLNKMDLVGYRAEVFHEISQRYADFLAQVGIRPVSFIPLAARDGENLLRHSANMGWYEGPTLLGQLESFLTEVDEDGEVLRFPVQDVYKFTRDNDDRRILAGMVTGGQLTQGDEVIVYPSGKRSRVRAIEGLPHPGGRTASAGMCVGVTLEHPLYVRPGEVLCRANEAIQPVATRRFRAHCFWMGNQPLKMNQSYKMKLGTTSTAARLVQILQRLESAELSIVGEKSQLDRYDVAECVFEIPRPVAVDRAEHSRSTGRFVIIDDYHICGCGTVLEPTGGSTCAEGVPRSEVEAHFDTGYLSAAERASRNGHQAKLLLFAGPLGCGKRHLARLVEKALFTDGVQAVYLGMESPPSGLSPDPVHPPLPKEAWVQRIGALSRSLTSAGLVFLSAVDDLDDGDLEELRALGDTCGFLIVSVGDSPIDRQSVDLALPPGASIEGSVAIVAALLRERGVISSAGA